jgi:hypothetical protein
LGEGDHHDRRYDDTRYVVPLYGYISNATQFVEGHCQYAFVLYSSSEFEASRKTKIPIIVTVAVAVIFLLVAVLFMLYDKFVRKRNDVILEAASRSHAILTSLFPSNVRDRLFAEKDKQKQVQMTQESKKNSRKATNLSKYMMGGLQQNETDDKVEYGYAGKPIADLFTEATVLFADLAGFTCTFIICSFFSLRVLCH